MLKKSVYLVAALLLAFTLAGCGANYSDPTVLISHNRIHGGKMNVVIGAVYDLETVLQKADSDIDPNLKVIWSSSDTRVVSVDANGMMQGRKAGEAVITAAAGKNSDSVTVTVSYGHQLPDSSLSSTSRTGAVSNYAFDRKESTLWISDITKSADEETEWLQACYNVKREAARIVVKMSADSDYAVPVKVEVFGLENMLDLSGAALGSAASHENGIYTITMTDNPHYKYFKIVFTRGEDKKDFAVSEVEIYPPESLTK